jgi:branched-chain amino acid aminotransferase
LTKNPLKKPDLTRNDIPFGIINTDHMLEVDYIDGEWQKPIISAFHDLQINPMNNTLHYAVGLFEGMKAFKTENNKINMFRADKNMERMNNSAKRVTLHVKKIIL